MQAKASNMESALLAPVRTILPFANTRITTGLFANRYTNPGKISGSYVANW